MGVHNPENIVKDFWNTINSDKVNACILKDENVQIVEYDKQINVVVIQVPQAAYNIKPVYINGNVYKGTFKRNFEGDYHCEEGEVKAMIRDANEDGNDGNIVEYYTMDDIDVTTLKNYRNEFENHNIGHFYNQLDDKENRGTYWISRLLEQFGCKLCIGGHKHTYALSYPIKENYQWSERLENKVDDKYQYGDLKNSLNNPKPMSETLEDESGSEPKYKVSWVVKANHKVDGNPYNINQILSESGDINISSTKLPYIPEDLYNKIGKNKFTGNSDYYRCCTPVDTTDNSKYDGFINYSMCQATGYKLKSNKELPSAYQVFSKLIPMTTVKSDGSDNPNENQLYPMFSILEFKHDGDNNDIVAINVMYCMEIYSYLFCHISY